MPTPRKSLALLFIGNSFTNRNDLPGLLERLALAARPPRRVKTERVIANGMSLKTHWDRGLAAKMIGDHRWDYVILQDQSTMGYKNPARLKEYAARFDAVCRQHHAKTALYMTWCRQDELERQNEITAAYQEAARPIKALLIPVGVAWQKTMNLRSDIGLYDRDKSHPSPAGTYLAACVFFAKLLVETPIGLPAEGVTASDASVLQKKARSACSEKRS